MFNLFKFVLAIAIIIGFTFSPEVLTDKVASGSIAINTEELKYFRMPLNVVEIKPTPDRILPNFHNTYDPTTANTNVLKYLIYHFDVCSKKNCIVVDSPGGSVRSFYEDALKIKRGFTTVAIIGECISACTGLADTAIDHVCITSETKMKYHTDNFNRIPLYFSIWTLDWIIDNGGFPLLSSGKFLVMPYSDAKEHWRTCNSVDLGLIKIKKFRFPNYLTNTHITIGHELLKSFTNTKSGNFNRTDENIITVWE